MHERVKGFKKWPIPFVHQLNTTSRIRLEILFVMLIGAIVLPFTLGNQCLLENKNPAMYLGSCIQVT